MPYLIVMIKNIIFDMGQVLARFDPHIFIKAVGVDDPKDFDLLMNEVYKSKEWIDMDRGTLTSKQGCEKICKRLPERLHNAVAKLTYDWDRPMMPVEGMKQLIQQLKQDGYKIYLLSNANDRQKDYWLQIPGSEYFDGTLVSYEVKYLKPEKQIYECLLNRFSLNPNECIFIDDSPTNCKAAKELGIESIVFVGDTNVLKDELIKLNIIK